MSGGYEAAVGALALFERRDRAQIIVAGRSPGQMLNGIVTGTVPEAPERQRMRLLAGHASYTAVLTPKGKMITDGRLFRLVGEAERFLLDVPLAGRDGLLAHFARFLPPRLASSEDVSDSWAVLSVVGPRAAERLVEAAFESAVDVAALSELGDGAWWTLDGPDAGDGVLVLRWSDVWPQAYDVLGPADAVAALREGLTAAGAETLSAESWEVLRVEAGRPAFGVDMDEDTIPVEAGIHERAIDYAKGCYTGQEVIVRIRDRGHVNRTLRTVRLGDVAPPAPGAELFAEGAEKSVGVVTSAVRSPRAGETIALAYVRRGVDPSAVLRSR